MGNGDFYHKENVFAIVDYRLINPILERLQSNTRFGPPVSLGVGNPLLERSGHYGIYIHRDIFEGDCSTALSLEKVLEQCRK